VSLFRPETIMSTTVTSSIPMLYIDTSWLVI
jgi:hypothetical protein